MIVHGIVSDGKVDELKVKNHTITKHKEGPPELVELKLCSVSDINNFIGSVLSTVTIITTRTVYIDTEFEMDRQIKILLSNFHKAQFDFIPNAPPLKVNNMLNIWLIAYNYQYLLNLPTSMEMYGPSVNLWEDDNQGKGSLKHTKPIITDDFSKSWHINPYLKLFTEKN